MFTRRPFTDGSRFVYERENLFTDDVSLQTAFVAVGNLLADGVHNTKEDSVSSHPIETGAQDRDAVAAGIVRVLVKILKVQPEQIRLESRLAVDLRADSLDLAEIAAELEDEFHIKVEEAQVHTIATVGEAIDYVRSLQSS